MPLAETLQKVEGDIDTGDLGKARARLHGLIASYPDRLELREQLGAVYWKLQFPEMAGRYWYLVENKDERMQAACKRFEDGFRSDPLHILLALKFKGDADALKDTYAGHVLEDLNRRARQKYPWHPSLRKESLLRRSRSEKETRANKIRNIFATIGCVIALAVLVILAIAGLLTTITTVAKWLQ